VTIARHRGRTAQVRDKDKLKSLFRVSARARFGTALDMCWPAACAGIATLVAACGSATHPMRPVTARRLPPDYLPLTLGAGARYRPVPTWARTRAGAPVDGLRCVRPFGKRFGAHLEVFAHQHVVAIPAGIGIASPRARTVDASVLAGRCYYPATTTDPTGVIEVRRGARVTLGELFDIWGEPLGRRAVARFRAATTAPVVAYVNGRRWSANPRAIALLRHELVVLEVASHVPPHRVYVFRRGL
jgi:hypothetical protein